MTDEAAHALADVAGILVRTMQDRHRRIIPVGAHRDAIPVDVCSCGIKAWKCEELQALERHGMAR